MEAAARHDLKERVKADPWPMVREPTCASNSVIEGVGGTSLSHCLPQLDTEQVPIHQWENRQIKKNLWKSCFEPQPATVMSASTTQPHCYGLGTFIISH